MRVITEIPDCCEFKEKYARLVQSISQLVMKCEDPGPSTSSGSVNLVDIPAHLKDILVGSVFGKKTEDETVNPGQGQELIINGLEQLRLNVDTGVDENLVNDVLLIDVVAMKLLEFMPNGKSLLMCRLVNHKWNDIVISTGPKHKQLEAKCGESVFPEPRRKNDDIACKCDLSIIGSSFIAPSPMRRFKLRTSWKDHMEKLNLIGVNQGQRIVKVESLELESVPLISRSIFEVPMHPSWVSLIQRSNFRNVRGRVTSLPEDLNWLEGGIQSILRVISPARFQELRSLKIELDTEEFYDRNTFTDVFYGKALECFENAPRQEFQLPYLSHFDLNVNRLYEGQGCAQRERAGRFVDTVVFHMIRTVCSGSPNLTYLGLPIARAGYAATLFPDTLDAISVPNLSSLVVSVRNQDEVDRLTNFIRRSKHRNDKFEFLKLILLFDTTFELSFSFDASQLLEVIGPTVQAIDLRIRTKANLSKTRWPIMPNLKLLHLDLATIKQFPGLNFSVKMPALARLRIEEFWDMNMSQLNWHELVRPLIKGDIMDIPEPYTVPAMEISSSTLRELKLCNNDNRRDNCCPMYPIMWNCPQLTSLTLQHMSCVSWFLYITKQFPALQYLDVTIVAARACGAGPVSYIDYAFTGLPFEEVYKVNRERAGWGVVAPVKQQQLCRSSALAGALPCTFIPERRDCLIDRKSLRHLTVTYSGKNILISDWAGYHGLAFMTHLETLTLQTEYIDEEEDFVQTLSKACREFVTAALAPKTKVQFLKKQVRTMTAGRRTVPF